MLVEIAMPLFSRERSALVLRLCRSIRVVNTIAMIGVQKRKMPQMMNRAVDARFETSEQCLSIYADLKLALLIRGAKNKQKQINRFPRHVR